MAALCCFAASEAVVALPNVPFPDPNFGVYPGDADDQNAAVRTYFVSVGLPESQILSIAADEAGLVRGQDVLQGWWSILNRGWCWSIQRERQRMWRSFPRAAGTRF